MSIHNEIEFEKDICAHLAAIKDPKQEITEQKPIKIYKLDINIGKCKLEIR